MVTWNVLDLCKLTRVVEAQCAIQNSCTEIWMYEQQVVRTNLPEMT